MEHDSSTPAWVHRAVFYQIFPDRFASSQTVVKPNRLEPWDDRPTPNGFKGGDLLGVVEHLDYLQDLGVNALYFTPVFQSACNHRYHTHDYFQVDPLLGGNAALQRLLAEAHRRNMRVILDGVFNHASRGFFQFNHILEVGQDSPYLDWFDVRGYPLNAYSGRPNYRCWADLAALPEFNHQNPEVVKFIYDVARYWVDQGIDGWRLDVAFQFGDDAFWQGFRHVVKTANPEAYITAEIVEDASRWLKGDQFDAVMNYLFAYCLWGFIGGEDADREMMGHWVRHAGALLSADTTDFARNVAQLLERYPRQNVLAQQNLLDSHDTARILSVLRGRKDLYRLMVLFQMTYPGAPMIYYGNEIGMEGGKDPDCRRAFPWDEAQWDHELREYHRRLIALRHAHPALQAGSYRTLYAQDGKVAVFRQEGADQAIVALNRSADTWHLDLDVSGLLSQGVVLANQLGPGQARVAGQHLRGAVIPPLSGALFI
jgi:cyclomaltodextrinase / maltogenic alpha-amylase / neopullulanase